MASSAGGMSPPAISSSARLPLQRGIVVDLAFAPDGKTLAAASAADLTGAVHLWELARARSRPVGLGRETVLRASWVTNDTTKWYGRQAVVYSPDCHAAFFILDSRRTDPCLTDTSDGPGASITRLRNTWNNTHVLAYSPDGSLVATASQDTTAQGDARLWDAATGKQIGQPLPHINWVSALAFSPDSKVLVTGGFDCAVHFWDCATAQRIGPYLRQKDIVLSLAFSADGKSLAVAHAWDYSRGPTASRYLGRADTQTDRSANHRPARSRLFQSGWPATPGRER